MFLKYFCRLFIIGVINTAKIKQRQGQEMTRQLSKSRQSRKEKGFVTDCSSVINSSPVHSPLSLLILFPFFSPPFNISYSPIHPFPLNNNRKVNSVMFYKNKQHYAENERRWASIFHQTKLTYITSITFKLQKQSASLTMY